MSDFRLFGVLVRTAVLLSVCANPGGLVSSLAHAADKLPQEGQQVQLRSEIGDMPWDAQALKQQVKVIYGTDDRIDVYQETDPLRLQLAASTCGLLPATSLINNGNGTYTIKTTAYTVSGLPACAGEPYAAQPTAMFCSGFLVGEDLIATAGHCYDSGDIGSTRFVFGFKMAGASSAVTTVNASQVYQGVAVIGHQLVGDYDYCVIRLDRKVTAPGAAPLPVRRTGVAPVGTAVGVIGHPSGLPLKIAFGAATEIMSDGGPAYFTANLDTYGGNSGSPVFDQQTGLVEGILVRGQTDFVSAGSCFVSNRLTDAQGVEEVSKATSFSTLIPGVGFSKARYGCGETVTIRVDDSNAPQSSLSVVVSTSSGDSETVTVTDPENDNAYLGSLPLTQNSSAVPGNGILEGVNGAFITVTYADSDTGTGSPATSTARALLDCAGPSTVQAGLTEVGADYAVFTLTASEKVRVKVTGGAECGIPTVLAQTVGYSASHVLTVSGLSPCSEHFLKITAIDEGGNEVAANGGECFAFSTMGKQVVLEEAFDPTPTGEWSHNARLGADNWGMRTGGQANSGTGYCGYTPGTASIADAFLNSPAFPAAARLEFYHSYAFETGYDGGVLEVSTDGGNSWSDLGSRVITGGYTGTISTNYSSPIGGRQAWTGNTAGVMSKVVVDLSGLTGPLRVRFRFTSDTDIASGGWYLDDVRAYSTMSCDEPCGYTLSPASNSFGAGGGNGTLTVSGAGSCPWQASTQANWISVISGTGTGGGTVTFFVAANTGTSARSGAILVDGQTHTVFQAGLIPAATWFAPNQKTTIKAMGSGWQEIIYSYSTGATTVTPYAGEDGQVSYPLPVDHWMGIYHYDYAAGRFNQAVYKVKLPL